MFVTTICGEEDRSPRGRNGESEGGLLPKGQPRVAGAVSLRQATIHKVVPIGYALTLSQQSNSKAQEVAIHVVAEMLRFLLSTVEAPAFR